MFKLWSTGISLVSGIKIIHYLGFQIYYTELYQVFSNGVFQFSVYLFLFWMFVLSHPFFFFFFKLSKLVVCLLISSKTRFYLFIGFTFSSFLKH